MTRKFFSFLMMLTISCSVMGCGGGTENSSADDPVDVPEGGDPAMDDEIDASDEEAKPPGAA